MSDLIRYTNTKQALCFLFTWFHLFLYVDKENELDDETA